MHSLESLLRLINPMIVDAHVLVYKEVGRAEASQVAYDLEINFFIIQGELHIYLLLSL